MITKNFQNWSEKVGKVVERAMLDGHKVNIFFRNDEGGWEQLAPDGPLPDNPYYMMAQLEGIPCTWCFLPDVWLLYAAMDPNPCGSEYGEWARQNAAWEALEWDKDIPTWEHLVEERDIPLTMPQNSLLAHLA